MLALNGCFDVDEAQNKAIVLDVLDALLNEGDTSVIADHFSDPYLQHNPTLDNGTEALAAFVLSLQGTGLSSTPFRAVAQDDLVAVHSRFRFGEDDPGFAAIDIFRFEDERIIEHWDVIQPVVIDTLSGNSMFEGGGMNLESVDSEQADEEEAVNIESVTQLYEGAFNDQDLSVVDELVAEGYVQHSPQVADGRDGLLAALEQWHTAFPDMHIEAKRFIAEGDLVFAHVQITFAAEDLGDESAGLAGVDIFRFEDGLIVEHWDAVQEVPAETVSGNSMF